MDTLTLKSKWFAIHDLKWKAQDMEHRARETLNGYLSAGGARPWTDCMAQFGCGKQWLGPDLCRDDIAYLTTQRLEIQQALSTIQQDLGIEHAPSFTFDELRTVIDGALDIPLNESTEHQKPDHSTDSKTKC